MRFLLLFTGWATVLFVVSWFVSHGYQTALGVMASRLASPPGSEIEMVDLELFYPYELGIFAALCLASSWTRWRRRMTAIAVGLPILAILELISLVVVMKVLLAVVLGATPESDPGNAGETVRFVDGVVRIVGLAAAAAAWFVLLGRERLSLAARTWIGGGERPSRHR